MIELLVEGQSLPRTPEVHVSDTEVTAECVVQVTRRTIDPRRHLTLAICGHVDSGKETLLKRLTYSQYDLEALADRQRSRGIWTVCGWSPCVDLTGRMKSKVREMEMGGWRYTVESVPGYRNGLPAAFRSMSRADVGLLLVPADNFWSSVARENHRVGEVAGVSRTHSQLLNVAGVTQLIVCINKVDSYVARYQQKRYDELKEEMGRLLLQTGWSREFIAERVLFLPISGLKGDNVGERSENMPWWKGQTVKVGEEEVHITTLSEALEIGVCMPERRVSDPLMMPIEKVLRPRGTRDVVVTGGLMQGLLLPGQEVVFLPTHTRDRPCTGRAFTIEAHRKSCDLAQAGDVVGVRVKGLHRLPRRGDVMVPRVTPLKKGVETFTAVVKVLDGCYKLHVGYSPLCLVKTGKSAVRVTQLVWKVGAETGMQRVQNPEYLKAKEVAEVVFTPLRPLFVDTFDRCKGFARAAMFDGGLVMIGKIVRVSEN